ncbi:hypothetical protein GYMLUDRAFT_241894 [Collybiopsis luxurians FD-317 M1]|uniref:Uncharacterized protein n=1 Tax=Collybiopsis luxurians FD-317 M1 TaxID=944289 RepID=A0A0D0C5K7_9AGAR|nr:hypothetical protein GYMLUDRAFT_241894 [Collybiopsis luxurians FD-317 M1]
MDEEFNNRSFTDSLSADIIVLSSFLHGEREPGFRAEPDDRTSLSVGLVKRITTLLTTGSSKDVENNSVNAVIARIDPSSVECHIFSDNYSMEEGGSQNEELVSLTLDADKGEILLRNWEREAAEFDLDVHVADVFHIIRYLQNVQKPDGNDYLQFQLLIHHRASPLFEIMKTYADELANGSMPMTDGFFRLPHSSLTRQFTVVLDQSQYLLLHDYAIDGEKLSRGNTQKTSTTDAIFAYKYMVDSDNVRSWINLFSTLWQKLEMEFFVQPSETEQLASASLCSELTCNMHDPESVKWDSSGPSRMRFICRIVGIFYALKPVLKHILSASGNRSLLRALQDAEYESALRRNKVDHELKQWDKGHQNQMDESAASYELESILESNESSAARVLRFLDHVTAWYSAVVAIWTKVQKWFAEKRIEVHHFRYKIPVTVHISTAEIENVLHQINPMRRWTFSDVNVVQRNMLSSSVHTEAVLMGWVFSSLYRTSSSSMSPIPIGMATKCCRSCSLFNEIIAEDSANALAFVLLGAHSIFFSWMPPPGVPDHILLRFRNKLLRIAQRTASGSSTQYSETPSVPDDMEYFKSCRGVQELLCFAYVE